MQSDVDPGIQPLLSVIIPTLNEAAYLPNTLTLVQKATAVEIIIVDGGSQDDTVRVARSLGVSVIETAPGRAYQMNAGAIAAKGSTLLFLHGDTHLPAGFDVLIDQILAQPGVVAGAFALKIDDSGWGLRLVEWGVNWRSRLLQLPYGDQAIFLKTELFHRLGGFPALPIMEDFELMRQLRRLGKIAIAPAAVLTSGRRWQKLGIYQTTLMNQLVIFAYLIGVSPTRIAAWYRNAVKR